MGLYVPPRRGGQRVRRIGHQRDLFGLDFQHQVHEFFRGVTFDIELCLHQRTQFDNVVAADMAFIGPGMDGDAVRSESLAVHGHLFHVGSVLSPGVAQRGHLVYIDAQICKHFPDQFSI